MMLYKRDTMEYRLNRAWAEIDLDAIAHNVREIKKLTGNNVEMMGVVKADAYGHGVLEVVRTLLDNGVTQLAVSMLENGYLNGETIRLDGAIRMAPR